MIVKIELPLASSHGVDYSYVSLFINGHQSNAANVPDPGRGRGGSRSEIKM
jgi:hypothetical protein